MENFQINCLDCKCLLIEPYTLSCRHSYCSSCLNKIKSICNKKCLVCRQADNNIDLISIDLKLTQQILEHLNKKYDKQNQGQPPQEEKNDQIFELVEGARLGKKYELIKKIGSGSFGSVFLSNSQIDKKKEIKNIIQYAIKFETRSKEHSSLLVREIKVLQKVKQETGFAQLIDYGKFRDKNFAVFSLLGPDLQKLYNMSKETFSMLTILEIFSQGFQRINKLHNLNLIHRDIKPDNFLVGNTVDTFNTLFLIDFGLAKYIITNEGNHIEIINDRGMIGNIEFASENALLGIEQSRRDDLESLGYLALYYAKKGKLPWYNLKIDDFKQKQAKIAELKSLKSLESVCKDLPQQFFQYFSIVKSLQFDQEPNYQQLHSLVEQMIIDQKKSLKLVQYKFEWNLLPYFQNIINQNLEEQKQLNENQNYQSNNNNNQQQISRKDHKNLTLQLIPVSNHKKGDQSPLLGDKNKNEEVGKNQQTNYRQTNNKDQQLHQQIDVKDNNIQSLQQIEQIDTYNSNQHQEDIVESMFDYKEKYQIQTIQCHQRNQYFIKLQNEFNEMVENKKQLIN